MMMRSRSKLIGGKVKGTSNNGPGWAAFDPNRKGKSEPETEPDPYPSLSLSEPTKTLLPNNKHLNKPFSSVLVSTEHDELAESCEKLKLLHPWADQSLVRDILAGVDNDMKRASSLLESMVDNDEQSELGSKIEQRLMMPPVDKAHARDSLSGNHGKEIMREHVSFGDVPDGDEPSLRPSTVKFVPIEPEWQEDDVYLVHRKDAMKMMRSASRHSKAANDAYIRGDHLSAHHFSLKAREGWIIAEQLNAKAVKEILQIRNSTNDAWSLDLHGLHATEAVQALHEHLQKVESLLSSNGSMTSNKELGTSSLLASKISTKHPLHRQRPIVLDVITGKGNHSRGGAALPSAIRNFLIENGYHFDEARPGVVTVRPKYRQH